MSDTHRSLTVLADGAPVPAGRVALSGQESLGLFPSPFTLRLWNLPEESFLQLSRASFLSVQTGTGAKETGDGSLSPFCLVAGKVSDVCRQTVREGTLTAVVFSPALSLWEAQVSLSVPVGSTVSDAVRAVLTASGTDIPLLSAPVPDPQLLRGQACFGRAAESISSLLSAASSLPFLVPSGLITVPATGLPVSLLLSEQDLTDAPAFAGRKEGSTSAAFMLLSVYAVGFRPGQTLSLSYHGQSFTGLIRERRLELYTSGGPWSSQLLVELS